MHQLRQNSTRIGFGVQASIEILDYASEENSHEAGALTAIIRNVKLAAGTERSIR